MPTPASGAISMSDINANFGRGTDLNAYRNTIWYQPASLTFGYFNSGTISMSDFYNKQGTDPAGSGASDYTSPGTYFFVVPLFRNFLQIQVWGAGGAGGEYVSGGGVVASGAESRVYMPNGEQLAGFGGGGGQNAQTSRFGGNVFGAGGGGGGAGGGNQQNVGGQAGFGGDAGGMGGAAPAGGGTTGSPPNSTQGTPLYAYNGNFPGGGASSFRFFDSAGKYNAFGGGGGGGGYARSVWGGGTFYTQTVTIVIGAGGGSAVSTGANGRVYINWG